MASGTENVDKATPEIPGTDVTRQIVFGAQSIYGLSRGVSEFTTGTYNATEVLGFWVTDSGTALTLTCNYKDGTSKDWTTAEIDLLIAKDIFVPFHCTSLVVDNSTGVFIINRAPV